MAEQAGSDEAQTGGALPAAATVSPGPATTVGGSPEPAASPPPEPAAAAQPTLRKARNRRRRLELVDRAIPLLAAVVGLVALAGAVMIEWRTDQRTHQMATEVAEIKAGLTMLQQQTAAVAKAQDNGTVEGLLALQDRIAKLEAAAKEANANPVAASTSPGSQGALEDSPAPLASTGTTTGTVGQVGPQTDCIPVGLRFMATPNEDYPLCQTAMVLKIGTIGDGTVDIAGTGTVTASGFGTIPDTKCTVMVFSADPTGFAELRVSCT